MTIRGIFNSTINAISDAINILFLGFLTAYMVVVGGIVIGFWILWDWLFKKNRKASVWFPDQ
jgi:hypothetical protein